MCDAERHKEDAERPELHAERLAIKKRLPLDSRFFDYLQTTLLRQFERHHVVTLFGAQRAVTASDDQHILLTILPV